MKFLIFIALLLIQSCYSSDCNSKIEIENIVIEAANNINISYCDLVNNSLNGNPYAIKKLLCHHYFDGESSYLHSFYVYKISQELGEDKVISIMKSFNEKKLLYYYSNLEFGIEQTNINKSIEIVFPKLYQELWNNKNPMH